MITPEQHAEIRRLHYGEHWKVGTIAAALGVHHDTVRAAIAHDTQGLRRGTCRATLLDPYLPFIRDTLAQYPRLRATRLFEMVKSRGYPGSVVQLRRWVHLIRPAATAMRSLAITGAWAAGAPRPTAEAIAPAPPRRRRRPSAVAISTTSPSRAGGASTGPPASKVHSRAPEASSAATWPSRSAATTPRPSVSGSARTVPGSSWRVSMRPLEGSIAISARPAPATTRDTPPATATAADSAPPAAATARCRDGTYSETKSTRGACSSHGGVSVWLITGTCKDGTVTRATTR